MTETLTPPPPSAAASQALPSGAVPAPDPTAVPQAYHRAARMLPHRRFWWRPLVALAVAAAAYVVMCLQLMVPLLLASVIWPSFAMSPSGMDPLVPLDQLLGLGSLALMVPAVLVGTLAGYGRALLAVSVAGRFRWGLLGRAALVVLPVYLAINVGLNLILERDAIVVPPLSAAVIAAWLIAIVLAPLQCAGEEFAFRALPLQALGTWVRTPIVGILLPVPLFVMAHGYDWLGQIDIAVFAIVMGALAWKTGGLEIPILLHTANNLPLFAIAPLIPGFTEQGEVSVLGFVLAISPMLLLSAGIWVWFSRREGLRFWEPKRGTAQALWVAGAAGRAAASSSSAVMTSRPLSV